MLYSSKDGTQVPCLLVHLLEYLIKDNYKEVVWIFQCYLPCRVGCGSFEAVNEGE